MILSRVTQLTTYYRIQSRTSLNFGPCYALNIVPKNFMYIIKMKIEIRFNRDSKSNKNLLIRIRNKSTEIYRGKKVM